MKHQYVGDINDYRKYALLRALSSGGGNRIGVCWMLTPDDGGNDGGKRGYLRKPKQYRHNDPELFDLLQPTLDDLSLRKVSYIEESGVIPGATFYNPYLPPLVAERATYMADCRAKFAATDLVFLDPDTGIEKPNLHVGKPDAPQYVFLDEIAVFYGSGRSLLIYQHRRQGQFMGELIASKFAQLRTVCPDARIWAFSKDAVAFFLLVHPESPARLAIAAMEACGSLDPSFVCGEYLGSGSPPGG